MMQNVIELIIEKKKIVIAVTSVVAALLLIYLGISIYFMDHFYLGSKIGDVDVSGKSAAEAEKVLQEKMDEYKLTIKERDGETDFIAGDEIALSIEWNTKPENYIDKQIGFDWIVKISEPVTYEIDGTFFFDDGKLSEKIAELSAMKEAKQIAPIDAKVSEYDAQKGYTLIPSVPGTAVDVEIFTASIQECIRSLDEDLDMEEENCYIQPKISDDNETLLALIDELNQCLETVITYQVGDKTQVLDESTFQPWLYVKDDFTVAVDEEAVAAYVKELSSTYNTCYSAKKFMTSYGQEITITNSHYGWKVDRDAETAAIVADIMAGVPVTRDLNYSMTANSHGANDYGNSYVEINLTAQHLFLYVNGQRVLETDFVSGNTSKNWDTPTGIWGVTYKTKDATLRGADYTTPVEYWMPFAGNVGMHDAWWRTTFGASYYKREGSHGCLNIPPAKAKVIYGYVSKNFPVIVYQLEGTQTEEGIEHDKAYVVMDAIDAIGIVSIEEEYIVTECRAQYEALSDLAKSFVTNYQVLVDAEDVLDYLKEKAGM